MLLRKQSGMTLIEVLIAAIILFMAIGLVTSAFQQSILLQRKVMTQREKVELIHIVKPFVQFEISQGKLIGNLDYLSRSVDWQAKQEAKSSFVDAFSESGDDYVVGRGYVTLYDVVVKQDEKVIFMFKYSIWSSS